MLKLMHTITFLQEFIFQGALSPAPQVELPMHEYCTFGNLSAHNQVILRLCQKRSFHGTLLVPPGSAPSYT